jgi:hypothetical protein
LIFSAAAYEVGGGVCSVIGVPPLTAYTVRRATARRKTAYASVSETLALARESCSSLTSAMTSGWRTA